HVGGQVDAGDEPPVAADEEVGDAPGDLVEQRQAAAAAARLPGPRGDVADAVADQRHGVIEQVRDQDAAGLARASRPGGRVDLDVQPLGHDVQPGVGGALAGDDA